MIVLLLKVNMVFKARWTFLKLLNTTFIAENQRLLESLRLQQQEYCVKCKKRNVQGVLSKMTQHKTTNIYSCHSMCLKHLKSYWYHLKMKNRAERICVSHLTQRKKNPTKFQTVLELKTSRTTEPLPQEPLCDICSLQSEGAFWSLMTQISAHCVNLMAACAAQRWVSGPQAMNTFLKMAPADQTGPEHKANKDWPLAPLLFPHFHC